MHNQMQTCIHILMQYGSHTHTYMYTCDSSHLVSNKKHYTCFHHTQNPWRTSCKPGVVPSLGASADVKLITGSCLESCVSDTMLLCDAF
jgi:hypothetical protein